MMQNGKRIRANPILIRNDEEPRFLKRIPTTEKLFQEDWLQKLIFEHPSLLPASEIESAFSPLISIGREIPTSVGSIDNLFISPQGYLTIVETKLWRNPEARREVVGQIVDYAKDVSKWSFDDLDTKVKTYFKTAQNRKIGIIDAIREHNEVEDEEESELIDAITKHMRNGHFLLFIVGDGIRESVEDMTDYLSQTPQLHFTLALVELKVFEMEDGRLVLPQLVMRTLEITRAIIRIEGGDVKNVSVGVDIDPESPISRKRRFTLSEEEYFTELSKNTSKEGLEFARQLIDDMQDLGCEVIWRQSSFVIRYPDPFGLNQLLTLLVVNKRGEVYTGWLSDQLRKINLSGDLGGQLTNQIHSLLKDCEVNPSKPGVWSLEKIMLKHEELLPLIEQFINELNNKTI